MQRRQLIGACALVVIGDGRIERRRHGARALVAADAASIEARVNRLFARWQTPDSPGCSVGVSRGGATVLERGYGRASLELGVPITPESVFHVASVTKQFTAMSILLLARDGRLSIDDDVRRHLPEWAGPPGVTIRHLLTHTGGLRDAFLLIEMAAPETSRPTHDQLVGLLARQRGLSEEPGRRYVYNNGGYVLLAEIVKRVSGQSLRAFADARIFRPLGMRQSHLHDDVAEIVPKLATGYTRGGDGALRVARQPGGVVGNAGLFTTAGDLLRWQRNFAAPRVGDAALVASMETPPALPGGETTVYGLGLQVERHGGRRTVGHGGGDPGASAYVVRYPEHDLAVAVLCNLDGIDSIALARGVADIYLGEATGPRGPAAGEAAPTPSTADLAANEGLYRDPTDETLLRIFLRDGTLRGSPAPAPMAAGPSCRSARTVSDSRRPRSRWSSPPVRAARERCASSASGRRRPSSSAWRPIRRRPRIWLAWRGTIAARSCRPRYALRVREGTLVADVPGRASIALQPIRPDTFAGSLVGAITFARDRDGHVTGFTVHAYAARGLRFERVRRASTTDGTRRAT